jgi:hypothetical protein
MLLRGIQKSRPLPDVNVESGRTLTPKPPGEGRTYELERGRSPASNSRRELLLAV